jgi:hypothetical protein
MRVQSPREWVLAKGCGPGRQPDTRNSQFLSASDLNTTGQTAINLTPDGKALSPQATDVFLVIQYTVSGL